MRDDLRNKQGPPTKFPFRQGNRIISDRHLTADEIIARKEERAALDKARKYRKSKSRDTRQVDVTKIKPVDQAPPDPEDSATSQPEPSIENTETEVAKPKSRRSKKTESGASESS